MDDRRIAALDLLERMRRNEIESETRDLGRLRAEAQALERRREELESRLDEGASCQDPVLQSYLGNFVRAVRAEMTRIDRDRATLEARIAELADRVAEAFREIKTYELLRLDALARKAAERQAKDEAELGEAAQIRWWLRRRAAR